MEDVYQEINLGDLPVRYFKNDFTGAVQKFSLRLRNYDLKLPNGSEYKASNMRVTFEGNQDDSLDNFLLEGRGQGFNLQILDSRGYLAHAGDNMPAFLLNDTEQIFEYRLRLVRNGQSLKAGDYYTLLRFKMYCE
ncbi:hypothetical protein NIO33_004071 [Salmonella enterica]|nr:hypothetical protein [Salmonella enterica]